jgi:protein-L-isoaspartate(D-aspartate) O-methyltransferase
MFEDSYKQRGLRQKLVKKLAEKGIKNERVLAAINKVPIGEGQTISQPYTVAFQTEKLEIQPGDKILEIGTGSGYQACILMEMGAKVYTIEYNRKLYENTRDFLPRIGYKPYFFYGDGSKGLPVKAPFNKIIVTAGAPVVPTALTDQLAEGGILIIPVGDREKQDMIRIRKKDGKLSKEKFANFAFVPLLGEEGWEK